MGSLRKSGRPSFRRQGFLILLPVVGLAVVGVLSLRRDLQLTQAEARERALAHAQRLAAQLRLNLRGTLLGLDLPLGGAPTLDLAAVFSRHPYLSALAEADFPWQTLGDEFTNTWYFRAADAEADPVRPPDTRRADSPASRFSVLEAGLSRKSLEADPAPLIALVDAGGQLLYPPSRDPVPSPQPLDFGVLSDAQRELWEQTRATEFARGDLAAAAAGWREFLARSPPPPFDVLAACDLGLLLARGGETLEALGWFSRVIESPAAFTEAGLPVRLLARWHATRLLLEMRVTPAAQWEALRDLAALAVARPTAVSEMVLRSVGSWADHLDEGGAAAGSVQLWQRAWTRHEQCRALAAVLPAEPVGWARVGAVDWLILRLRLAGRELLVARTGAGIEAAVHQLFSSLDSVPDYLGLEIDIASRRFALPSLPNDASVGPAPAWIGEPLVTAAEPLPGEGDGTLATVRLALVNPEVLLQRQRQRQWVFGGLIAGCALVAVLGFFSAWSAFRRQQQLSELKSNFVSSVSHELRAPIASVRLLAEGLESGRVADAPKQREYFRFILQECRRLSSLLENVLDFARIEQGRKQYEFEESDLVALVRQTAQLLAPHAAERQVRLTVRVPDPPLAAVVDARAVQQALVNLLDNAIKYSPPSETVTVQLAWVEQLPAGPGEAPPPGGTPVSGLTAPGRSRTLPARRARDGRAGAGAHRAIRLAVADRGPGIPREEHDRIFERFYRRGSELRRETQGVGIGLSIVKHVAEAHGGRVWVESEPGRGSRFVLELPASPPPGTSDVG